MSYQKDVLMQDQLVLHQFLCIALGGNSFLHPYIDKCYEQKEWDYYEAYQKSRLKGNSLFSMYTTNSEEKIRQVAGIVVWCYECQQFSQIDQLIKKGYGFAYRYFQQHKQIDFEQFMRKFAKRKNSKIVKELELIYQNIILWYLCVRENRPFNTSNVAWKSFQDILLTWENDIELQESMFSKEMIDQHRQEIDHLYDEYDIPKNLQFDSLGFFIEYLIGLNLKKITETNDYHNIENAEQHVFLVTPGKYIGAIGGWFKTLKIHELDATEQIPFNKDDLNKVFLQILYAQKYQYITKAEKDLFFITCLYLKCIGSHYHDTKQLYLDQSKHDFYLEVKSKEAEINKKAASLFQREHQWQCINRKQEKMIEGLSTELREAQAHIRQLEDQIKNMENYSDEVHGLRNFIYREKQKEDSFETVPSLELMIDVIQSKRIVIFGGITSWQQKLKELLPTVEIIDVEEKNRDIAKIQRVDAVFINTSVFSHAFYRKIMKELSKRETKTPLFYLNGQCNLEKSISEIYFWLRD